MACGAVLHTRGIAKQPETRSYSDCWPVQHRRLPPEDDLTCDLVTHVKEALCVLSGEQAGDAQKKTTPQSQTYSVCADANQFSKRSDSGVVTMRSL